MVRNIAVILAGCGYLDGAEIRESVLTLLSIEQYGAKFEIFSVNNKQFHTINHINGEAIKEDRNILDESARIARGQISDISKLNPDNFHGLLLPGGYGVAKNFCNIATEGTKARIDKGIQDIILKFHKGNKPIGAICISPALIALAFKGHNNIKLTLGDDNKENRELIEGLGSTYVTTKPSEICSDSSNNIYSCAAYMRNSPLPIIYDEINQLVKKVIDN